MTQTFFDCIWETVKGSVRCKFEEGSSVCVIERGIVSESSSWAALLWAEKGGGLTLPYMVRLN